jgi:sialate O-acetylesterase
MRLWLPAIIGDGMVIQQARPVLIWGKCEDREVHVHWYGRTYTAYTDVNQCWQAVVEAVPAGGPYELIIESSHETRQFRDILCGEVWFASGQSNMAMVVNEMHHGDEVLKLSDHPGLRLFKIETTRSDMPSNQVESWGWTSSEEEHSKKFSAVAYLFGRLLHERLQVPVGMIVSAVGATGIQSWMSGRKQQSTPELRELCHRSEQFEKKPENQPARLFNGMVAGIVPYGIRGVLWYQGERNANQYDPSVYGELLQALIEDWREQFREEALPFLYVQLPAFEAKIEHRWARLRQEQAKVADRVPGTGMVVALDLGERHNIHPKDKYPVAERLFHIALDQVYGLEPYAGFPRCRQANMENDRIILEFEQTGSGLIARFNEPLHGFEVCLDNGEYTPVEARVFLKQPVTAIRYAWRNWMEPSLFNKEGLPAAPFLHEFF